uniref:FAT domain-containing protein n=1 Tax=Macrostomum lignano TaxID=282301 RepID=A0A1I8FUD7_9PLAT
MRRHRINLNLLVDHNPLSFMTSVANFIDSIGKEDYINVFLAELDNVDVTTGMYSRAYACRQHGSSIDWSSLLKSSVASTSSSFQLSDVIRDEDSNKDSNANINKLVAVGSALLASLESRPPSQWLTCRLSAWVKLGRMDRALQLLAGGPADLLDAGFRHLLYLA